MTVASLSKLYFFYYYWKRSANKKIVTFGGAQRGTGTLKRLTSRPPGLCVLQRTHGVRPQRVHLITNVDWMSSNRPTVSNHSAVPLNKEYSPYVLDGWKVDALTQRSGLLGTGTWSWNRGAWKERKRRGVGRKKKKCLLNDIPIVCQSSTIALCKTANNERRRKSCILWGPGSMPAITIVI